MPIEFTCPQCGQHLRTPDESAGKHARCPKCQQVIPVPTSQVAGTNVPVPGTDVPPSPSPTPAPHAAAPFPENPFADAASRHAKPAPSEAFNPYASPTTREAPPIAAGSGELVHRTIDMGNVLNSAWKIFTEEFGQCALAGLVYFAVFAGLMIIGMIFSAVQQAIGSDVVVVVTQVLSFALNSLVQTWLGLGMTAWGVKMARTRRGEIADLFSVGPFLLRGIGASVLLALALFAGALVLVGIPLGIGAAVESEEVMVVGGIGGGLALLVLSLVVMLTIFLYYYFIVDRNLGAMESFRMSSRFMQGNRLSTFAVMLVVGMAGGMVVVCTCYLGLIVYAPFLALVASLIYLMATGQPHAAQQEKIPFKQF